MGRLPAPLGRQFGRMRTPSSLGAKLVMILSAVGLITAIAVMLLLAIIITPSFATLEDKAIDAYVERARAALSQYAGKVESRVRDYGDWNGSYAYMADADAAFERESFSSRAMANIDVNGIVYMTTEGRILATRWRDPVTGADRPAMRESLAAMIARTNLGALIGNRSSGNFYARIGDSVAAIGVARVRRSDGTGTSRGYVVMARLLTAKQLSALLRIGAEIDPSAKGAAVTVTSRPDEAMIAVPIIGADGRGIAVTRFSVPREFSLLGRRMLAFAVASSMALLVFVLLVLRLMIARLVLRPLRRVERHMQRVRVSGSLALLEEDGRRDEVGSLGRRFNAMLRQLKELRDQIEVQSFELGRSESAAAVMHNVRNALTPITTILSQGIAQVPPVDRATIDRAIDELAHGEIPDDRRRKLAAFVAAAIQAETAAREATRHELAVGRDAMTNVLEIIGQQQRALHERPALEVCDVSDIIARNSTIVRYSPGASIAFNFPAGPNPVMANRVILSQVIGNLFGNAVESIIARGIDTGTGSTGTGSGSVVATIDTVEGRVTIQIRDDGEGFSPEVAMTMFQRGFSTRPAKSGGLGLHWCANSMNAMDGSLRLESDGPGLGAVAILTLQAGVVATTEQDQEIGA
ncbi:MAG TPA: CHASE4 domain-containing protein [Sphingomonas sp.]|nr:CHASE4 domain-containing protein [Sphingomonas sp.]